MILSSRSMIPKAYGDSRDYQVLLKLLDLVVSSAKSCTDEFPSLIDPDKCPDHMLPLLADYVGYQYDNSESVNSNRSIIKYYPYLIRNRGSFTGFRLASALAARVADQSNSAIDPLSSFNVFVDEETSYIYVCVYDPAALTKIYDLLEVVRPAGVGVQVVYTKPVYQTDKVALSDEISYIKGNVRIGFIGTGEYTAYSETMDKYLNQIPYAKGSDDIVIDEFTDPDYDKRKYSAIVGFSEINELPEEDNQ